MVPVLDEWRGSFDQRADSWGKMLLSFAELLDPNKDIAIKVDFVLVDDRKFSSTQFWQYGLDGTKIAKKLLTTIAPGISEVAGNFYDDVNDWLWITDSEVAKIFLFKGEASSLLAIYDVPFIGNAESICVDSKRGCVWVGSDDSTSKIYKIAFSGL